MPDETAETLKTKSVVLKFSGTDGLSLFDTIEAEAKADERPIAVYLMRQIKKDYASKS
jgi:hypothetical protein